MKAAGRVGREGGGGEGGGRTRTDSFVLHFALLSQSQFTRLSTTQCAGECLTSPREREEAKELYFCTRRKRNAIKSASRGGVCNNNAISRSSGISFYMQRNVGETISLND